MGVLTITAGLLGIAAAAAYHYRSRQVAGMARVKVTQVRLTAGGSMLDVRYQVTRPGRLLAPKDEIYVIGPQGERLAQMMSVAKIGRLASRRSDLKTGGYLLLRNTGQVSCGDRVSVVIGRTRQDGMVVG